MTAVWGWLLILLGSSGVQTEDPFQKTSLLGPVTATVKIEPGAPIIGDSVELVLTVVAEPEVELIMPEFEEGLDRFLILGYAPREEVNDEGLTVATQRYTLRPPMSGEHSIPPLLVEFVDRREGSTPAPDGEDAYELLTERIDFEVQSVLPLDAAADLEPPLGPLPPREEPSGSKWPWVLGAAVFLALASPFLIRLFIHWRRLARRKSAYDVARARLERLLARPRPDGESVDPFFVELSLIVRQYLEDRFDLRAPELTTEEFLQVVSASPDISGEHQHLLRRFLHQADLVKFAHTVPGSEVIDDSVSASRRFLDETRENAPLLDAEMLAARDGNEVSRV